MKDKIIYAFLLSICLLSTNSAAECYDHKKDVALDAHNAAVNYGNNIVRKIRSSCTWDGMGTTDLLCPHVSKMKRALKEIPDEISNYSVKKDNSAEEWYELQRSATCYVDNSAWAYNYYLKSHKAKTKKVKEFKTILKSCRNKLDNIHNKYHCERMGY